VSPINSNDDDEPDPDASRSLSPAGMPDLGSLMDQLQQMQEAQTRVFEGQAGGGAVRISATGALEFESVSITPAAVDPDDVEMLQDLVLAALHDLARQVIGAQKGVLGGLDFGDLDLGGLGNLFGGPS
jgi:DNA-binding YbaB/EbfC family protein